jgi:hypothetical protein
MINNNIFETYTIQDKVKEQKKSIRLLASQGYTILDLEGNIINKWNIDKIKKPNIDYNRVPKFKK